MMIILCLTHSLRTYTILKPTHDTTGITASVNNRIQFNHIRNIKYHSLPLSIHEEYNHPMKSFSTFSIPVVDKEPVAIDYLEHELGLSTEVLKKIILKYPWILYLRVNTNIIPTIQVFYANNFKQKDIIKIISQIPSILAINHKYTLPEKLLSLQKMFYLNKNNLVKIVTAQPYLLTSSITRNLKTAEFLRNILKLNENEMKILLLNNPSIAMCSVEILKRCYGVLIQIYGLTPIQIHNIILRYPMLLTIKLVHNIKERLILFSSEFDIPSFPNPFIQQLALRFPPILYINTDIFLSKNIEILKLLINNNSNTSTTTSNNRKYLIGLIKTFPQFLGYNSNTLYTMILSSMELLTGRKHVFLHPILQIEYKNDDFTSGGVVIDECKSELFASEAGLSLCSSSGEEGDVGELLQLDSLSEAVEQYQLYCIDSSGSSSDSSSDSSSGNTTTTGSDSRGDDAIGVMQQSIAGRVQYQQQRQLEYTTSTAIEYAQEELSTIRKLSQAYLHHATSNTRSSCHSTYSTPEGRCSSYYSPDSGNSTYSTPDSNNGHSTYSITPTDNCTNNSTYYGGLTLDDDTAVRVLRTAPWIIAYRPERSRRVLAALSVSLSLTSTELSKCVAMYPR